MSEVHYIYMHKNKINNKIYIGQTIQYPENRWKNGAGYKTCTYFYRAIQEYGWDNFEHIILVEKEMSQEETDKLEEYYIDLYDATNPNKGYNILKGGQTPISPNALPAALEWMEDHPEWCKEKVKDCLKWQEEHPEEMYQYRLNSAKKMKEARIKPVICIETGIIYESATEAARHTPKTSQSKICMVCRGQRITSGGYHWKYLED